ncbi:MAG TPA: DUF2490 domain-containing protein, partial [Flavobacteriaceae bacterium]|nr:DUF2490 domain-containing protein [Flavobacteriaceae bacterium]
MKAIVKLAILLVWLTGFSQSMETEVGTWYTVIGSYKLNEKVSFGGVAELRDYQFSHNLNFFYVQGVVNYKLNKKFSLTGGYLFGEIDTTIEPSNKPNVIEHRLLEQINFKTKLNKLAISQRMRLEQRFWNAHQYSEVRHRLRYRVKFKYPLNKTFYLGGYEELILRKNPKPFEQNLLSADLGINLD